MHDIKRIEGIIPDRETEHGRAWRVDLKRVAQEVGRESPAAICGWVLEVPWAHPLWCNYFLTAVHLRPVEGAPPPKILREGATHEVILYALNPDYVPDLNRPIQYHLLPLNFAGQWTEASDIAAEEKIGQCVDLILAGHLSPDTDFTQQWVQLFSNSNLKDQEIDDGRNS